MLELSSPSGPLGAGHPGCCSSLVAVVVKPPQWGFLSFPLIPFLSPALQFDGKCCFLGQLQGDRAGGCCPACPGSQEDGAEASLGSGVLCQFTVSIFLFPSHIPFGGRCRGILHPCRGSGRLEAASCTPPAPFQLQSCKKSFPKPHQLTAVLLFPHKHLGLPSGCCRWHRGTLSSPGL